MAYSDESRKETEAMILLGTWGSQSYPPQKWHKWRWAEESYAPEWLTVEDLDGHDPDDCVTVLDYSLTSPVEAPEGWQLVQQYPAGEHDCPDCYGREDGQAESYEGQPKQSECTLCQGDGVIYQGEECQVCVFAPVEREEG